MLHQAGFFSRSGNLTVTPVAMNGNEHVKLLMED